MAARQRVARRIVLAAQWRGRSGLDATHKQHSLEFLWGRIPPLQRGASADQSGSDHGGIADTPSTRGLHGAAMILAVRPTRQP